MSLKGIPCSGRGPRTRSFSIREALIITFSREFHSRLTIKNMIHTMTNRGFVVWYKLSNFLSV